MTTRRIAYNVLNSVIKDGAYLHLALKNALFGAEESAAGITALVYCTIENLNYADFLLKHFSKGRLHGSVRMVLRMGICELLFMNTPAHAVCNESVKLVKGIGKGEVSGVVNGILRNIDREHAKDNLPELPKDSIQYLNIRYGIPSFLAEEYVRCYGVEFTELMLKARFHEMVVRAQFPCTADELIDGLIPFDQEFNGISIRRGKLVSDALILDKGINVRASQTFKSGKLTVQSESAMLVCKICRPKPGMNILDACAAPGGKTAYLASIMENTGSITAWDVHESRVKLIEATLKRLNVKNAVCSAHDASAFIPEMRGSMDVVLADVPCSGFGVGSKPDTYLNRSEESVRELGLIQQSILETCSKYVKQGGALVYSTCTISKVENETRIASFLSDHPEFSLEPFDDLLAPEYSERAKSGMLQLFPHIDGTDGFFIARMVKK